MPCAKEKQIPPPDPANEGKVWLCSHFYNLPTEWSGRTPSRWQPWWLARLSPWQLLATAVAGVLVLAFIVFGLMPLGALAAALGGPVGSAFLLILAIGMIVGGLCALWRRSRRPWRAGASYKHNFAYRLNAAGTTKKMVSIGPIEDQTFEPEVFNVSFTLAREFAPKWLVWSMMTASTTVVLLLRMFYLPMNMPGDLWIMILLSTAGCVAVLGLTWPVFARVVPGRIDILSTGFLGRQSPPRLERYDLKTSRVWLDTNGGFVIIDDGTRAIGFNYTTAGGRNFARTILLAAVSTATPPELPDDELTG